MQQLNAYRLYELGAKLHQLCCADDRNTVADMFGPLTEAQTLLDSFIKGDVLILDASKTDANRLLNKIGNIFNRYYIDAATKQLKAPSSEEHIDLHELSLLRSLVEKFEHALAAELNRIPTYIADKCGIYSTADLAENAHVVFSESQRRLIPNVALGEVKTAGRALAFGLSTAATIHLLRAVECMLKVYFETFSSSPTAKGERNFASYLKKLAVLSEEEDKAIRPDRRTIQMLAQVKEQYRNPLSSPENAVTSEDAALLFGLSCAIISQMADQISARRQSEADPIERAQKIAAQLQSDDDETYDYRLSQAS